MLKILKFFFILLAVPWAFSSFIDIPGLSYDCSEISFPGKKFFGNPDYFDEADGEQCLNVFNTSQPDIEKLKCVFKAFDKVGTKNDWGTLKQFIRDLPELDQAFESIFDMPIFNGTLDLFHSSNETVFCALGILTEEDLPDESENITVFMLNKFSIKKPEAEKTKQQLIAVVNQSFALMDASIQKIIKENMNFNSTKALSNFEEIVEKPYKNYIQMFQEGRFKELRENVFEGPMDIVLIIMTMLQTGHGMNLLMQNDYSDQNSDKLLECFRRKTQILAFIALNCKMGNNFRFRQEAVAYRIEKLQEAFNQATEKRKSFYWSNLRDNFPRIFDKLLNDSAHPPSNKMIAQQLYADLTLKYGQLDYVYFVSVNDAQKTSNRNRILMCFKQCAYLYNYKNKDIRVFRTPDKSIYNFCDFKPIIEEACKNPNNITLTSLGATMAKRCDSRAISLVKNQLGYESEFLSAGFSSILVESCIGKINVAYITIPVK